MSQEPQETPFKRFKITFKETQKTSLFTLNLSPLFHLHIFSIMSSLRGVFFCPEPSSDAFICLIPSFQFISSDSEPSSGFELALSLMLLVLGVYLFSPGARILLMLPARYKPKTSSKVFSVATHIPASLNKRVAMPSPFTSVFENVPS